ncbi:MAG: LSm family protein [Promethearchaeota archaeon]
MRAPSIHLRFHSMIGKEVHLRIRLYQTFITGILESVDQYSNILLKNAVEFRKDDESAELIEKNKYSKLLLRGDSIITLTTI